MINETKIPATLTSETESSATWGSPSSLISASITNTPKGSTTQYTLPKGTGYNMGSPFIVIADMELPYTYDLYLDTVFLTNL